MTYAFVLDGQGDTPALVTAHAPLPEGWNGFAVPVATAAEVRAYVAAAVANDRNHVWTGEVTEAAGMLTIQREVEEDGDDQWTVSRLTGGGTALYALDGFVWEQAGDCGCVGQGADWTVCAECGAPR